MRLVIDASAAVNALVPGQLHDATLRHLEDHDLYAPELIDTEVLSALARLERAGDIDGNEGDQAVPAWQRLPCTRVSTSPLIPEIWAARQSLRISDAHYVALSTALNATLLTADRRLARAVTQDVSILTIT
ncbi:type II toxin-antitoxin system VapC family toxin [Ornithinimicrobium sp. W1679]|uniref:type II toxin-antitoxin system VapC family toxin n=1 Tax=Ornithinimicrobium sp. W1679 TaxID=3418770 RepID=UPI003CE7E264